MRLYASAAIAIMILLVAACSRNENAALSGTLRDVPIGGGWLMRQADDGFAVTITDLQEPENQGFILSRSSLSRRFDLQTWEGGKRNGYHSVYDDGKLVFLQQYIDGAESGLGIRFESEDQPEATLLWYEDGVIVAEKKVSDIDWDRR